MTDIGVRKGKLVVIGIAPSGTDGMPRLLVRCDCGKEKVVRRADFRHGSILSCGCQRAQTKTKHGMSKTKLYDVWVRMISRCYNSTDPKYYAYGARGIKVCDRWRHDFATFLADMGEPLTSQHSLDREDNDGNYGPENCRWATILQQAHNKRTNVYVVLGGERVVVAEAERRLGISSGSIHQIVTKQGLTPQQAVDRYVARHEARVALQ